VTVLITGATGCIGSALAQRFAASGEFGTVRVLVRSGSKDNALPANVERVTGSLEDGAEALRSAVRDVSHIFHAAAKVHDPQGSAEDFHRINADGTRFLVEACNREGVRPRLLFYSTVAVYGEETPLDGIPEDAPVNPVTPYAASKIEAENILRAWGNSAGAVVTIFRVATVYGPRDRGNMARMLTAIARGRFILPGDGNNRKTCVAVENVIRASQTAATLPAEQMADRIFVVADPGGPYTLRELTVAMAAALGRKNVVRSVPVAVLLTVAGGLEAVLGKRAPLTRIQVRRLAANNVYRTPSLSEMLDSSTAIPLEVGLQSAVASWRTQTTEG
jgi:nucleoside-diphosphate-sugar epimerase